MKKILIFLIFVGVDAYAACSNRASSGYMGNNYNYGGYNRQNYNSSSCDSRAAQGRQQYQSSRPIEEVTVTGRRPPPYSTAISMEHFIYHNPLISMPTSTGSGSSGSNNNQDSDKDTPQQCIDACKESLGEFYKWAEKLSPLTAVGAISTVVQELLAGGTQDSFLRRGLRLIHDPDPRNHAKGRLFISWSGLIGKFSKLSLHVGLIAGVSQAGMYSYCKLYQCSEKSISHSASNRYLTSKERYKRRIYRTSKYRYRRR